MGLRTEAAGRVTAVEDGKADVANAVAIKIIQITANLQTK